MQSKLFLLSVFALLAYAQAESACELQKKKEATNTSPLKLDVKCLPNGDYAPLQCFPSTKFCYCASSDGNQITSPSRNRKFCKCDLEKAAAEKKLNVNGRPIDRKLTFDWLPLTLINYICNLLTLTQLQAAPGSPSVNVTVCTTANSARLVPTSAGASTRMAPRSQRRRRQTSPAHKPNIDAMARIAINHSFVS